MQATIDRAGRIVVPKEIRSKLGLEGGESLEIGESNGIIEIRRPTRKVKLVRGEGGLLHADPDAGLPSVTVDEVRAALEATRERRS
ncbi:MAG: AbrB/MazE/SpoVT family DNA-binding domain-containing protein [Solirubrobacterales bacterium]